MFLLNIIRNRTYNKPDSMKMLVCQWAHQMYLWDIISHKKYMRISDRMYPTE